MAVPAEITIPAGDEPFSATIVVTATRIAIDHFASADPAIMATTPRSFDVDILDANHDDDIPIEFEITSSAKSTTEGGGSVDVNVSTTATLARTVMFSVSSSSFAEGVPSANVVSFDAANTSRTITVTGADEWIDDGDRSYTLDVGAHHLDLVNVDDDAADVVWTPITGTLNEHGSAMSSHRAWPTISSISTATACPVTTRTERTTSTDSRFRDVTSARPRV